MKQPVRVYINPHAEDIEEIIERPDQHLLKVQDQVSNIINVVQARGDKALFSFTKTFDGVELEQLEVTRDEIDEGCRLVDDELKSAMATAKHNIEVFHAAQGKAEPVVETQPGVLCWRKNKPIEKIGIYIPGGTAPLFSSVLMLAVPAVLAGCREIIMVTPPGPEGKVHPAVLYAAHISGVTKIFKVGGAQAIAALAFGTESIPRVDKIFGPGNRYVTIAKLMLSVDSVAIDMPAGPSEVLVFADKTSDPSILAADMLSQAEHGFDSQSILIVPDPMLSNKVLDQLKKQLEDLPRKEYALSSLKSSRIVCTKDRVQILDIINRYAPEHLIFLREDWEDWEQEINNAGSVFIGQWTPESAGDYASGTNHTLPTGGWAKSISGVSLESFQKHITYQKLTQQGFLALSSVIEVMAQHEGLEAHRRAVEIRKASLENSSRQDHNRAKQD